MNSKEYLNQAYSNTEGYISKMYIDNYKYGTYTHHYTADNLALQKCNDEENLYISQNTFFRPERNKDSLKHLNMLYVDLDCYKLGLSKEYTFMELCDNYFGSVIPRPTYIIDSGRGLYLLWRIDEDRNAFPRWKRVQHYLHDVLKDFGSDASVTEDVARVLRVPGSINTKSETKVNVLREYNYTYTLYEIMRDYIPVQEKLDKPKIKKYGNMIKITSLNTLFFSRIKDIETLLLMRDETDTSSLRENSLFMYRYCCCHYYNDTTKALEMTLELYSKLSDHSGYTEKKIAMLTKSAETYYIKRNRKFSNKKIIDLLAITNEEQTKLITLISKDNAKERKSERNKKTYLKRLEEQGRTSKCDAKESRRKRIKELTEANRSVETICTMLSISKSTYYRELSVIKEKDSLIRVTPKKRGTKLTKLQKNSSVVKLERSKTTVNSNEIIDSQKFCLCIIKDEVLSLDLVLPAPFSSPSPFLAPLRSIQSRGKP